LKFACDRCGKRFASVDEPAAGRVYRIRCRCGHVIVVRGPASDPRDAASRQLRHFEPPPVPPPLAPDEPSSADEPGLAPEGEWSVVRPSDAVLRDGPPALVTASPREPFFDDDSRLRAAGAETDTAGFAGAMRGDRGMARPPTGRGTDLAAESGAPLDVGLAALPAVAVRPTLSLGLDDDGASSARRRALLAAVIALLAGLATLALSRM
jgi:DNA-directed RNA polymerase subunit RPC12/RpoP